MILRAGNGVSVGLLGQMVRAIANTFLSDLSDEESIQQGLMTEICNSITSGLPQLCSNRYRLDRAQRRHEYSSGRPVFSLCDI